MPNHCTPAGRSTFEDNVMTQEQAFDDYQEYIEPSHLTLDTQTLENVQSHAFYDCDHILHTDMRSTQGSLPQDFPTSEPLNFSSSSNYMEDTPDFNADIHSGQAPFLWTGDYVPNTLDSSDLHSFVLDSFGEPLLHERYGFEYDFQAPFPGVGECLSQHPDWHSDSYFPPLTSFAPTSPPFYELPITDELPTLMDPFQMHSPQSMQASHPGFIGSAQLPLLPLLGKDNSSDSLGNLSSQGHFTTSTMPKKSRVDRRNSKPLTIEDLAHDNSRFAKVVKAFLSIEDQENRTVPEIANRVSDLYAGQYADFEGVKRMVNDVLQKHKAFWHPGRGSPYQLNLAEGRARREFPSNNKHHAKSQYDENLFYPSSKHNRHKKSRQPKKERIFISSKLIQPEVEAEPLSGHPKDV